MQNCAAAQFLNVSKKGHYNVSTTVNSVKYF